MAQPLHRSQLQEIILKLLESPLEIESLITQARKIAGKTFLSRSDVIAELRYGLANRQIEFYKEFIKSTITQGNGIKTKPSGRLAIKYVTTKTRAGD